MLSPLCFDTDSEVDDAVWGRRGMHKGVNGVVTTSEFKRPGALLKDGGAGNAVLKVPRVGSSCLCGAWRYAVRGGLKQDRVPSGNWMQPLTQPSHRFFRSIDYDRISNSVSYTNPRWVSRAVMIRSTRSDANTGPGHR